MSHHATTTTTDESTATESKNLPARAKPDVEEYFDTLKTYTRMAARGEQNGVLVKARPGIGKSFQIEEVLKDEVSREDSHCWDYSIKSGYVSPMALFETLYEQQAEGNVLVLDDIEGVASSDTAASILKAALEGQGSGDRRIVEWDSNSSRLDEEVPESFEFRGSIIVVCNDIPSGNSHWQAVESRCMTYEMTFTFEERMDLIREVAKAPYESLTYEERMEVANWLIRNTSSEMDHVDLRSLFKCFDLYQSSVLDGEEWKRHAAEQLGIDKETIVAKELLREAETVSEAARRFAEETHHPTERFFEVVGEDTEVTLVEELLNRFGQPKEAIDCFEEVTGKSRKTFYRRRDRL